MITHLTREELEDKVDEQKALLEGALEGLQLHYRDFLLEREHTFVTDLISKIETELGQ